MSIRERMRAPRADSATGALELAAASCSGRACTWRRRTGALEYRASRHLRSAHTGQSCIRSSQLISTARFFTATTRSTPSPQTPSARSRRGRSHHHRDGTALPRCRGHPRSARRRYLITSNGAHVHAPGDECVYARNLDPAAVRRLVQPDLAGGNGRVIVNLFATRGSSTVTRLNCWSSTRISASSTR